MMAEENVTQALQALLILQERVVELELHAAETAELGDALDGAWVLHSAVLVFLMQVGFALLEAGCVREDSVIATYSKNMLDFVISVFTGSFWGYVFAFPTKKPVMLLDTDEEDVKNVQGLIFFLTFQASCATIVSGCMAERTSVTGYLLFSIVMSGLIYPLGVRWVWGGGWLSNADPAFHDFAGSGVVHLVGGVAGLCGAMVVGPRSGRWDLPAAETFVAHSVPSVLLGCMFLWVGWYGFNPGSTLAMSSIEDASTASNAFLGTTMSAAASAVASLLWSLVRTRLKAIDILGVANSIIAGLVSITAGCDVIAPAHAMIVGAIAAVVYRSTSELLRWLRIDDVVDGFAVHGACGIWGVLSVGLFNPETGLLFGHGPRALLIQLMGCVALTGMSAVLSLCGLIILKRARLLRISGLEETLGLDTGMGVRAYNHTMQWMSEYRSSVDVLHSVGFTPYDAIDALEALRSVICRPFSPQSADKRLEGEVEDLLVHCSFDGEEDKHYFCFLSHHKADAGEVARVMVDTVRRLVMSSRTSVDQGRLMERLQPSQYIYLDSTNLKDLTGLCNDVRASQNLVILMTRQVLQRPWVLAELITAHKAGINTLCVQVEWPHKEKDPRAFRWPEDLDVAVWRWKEYIRLFGVIRPVQGPSLRAISPCGMRLVRHESTLSGDFTLGAATLSEDVTVEPPSC